MKMQQIREIAKERGVKAGKMSKTELIKAIQRAEVIMTDLQGRM